MAKRRFDEMAAFTALMCVCVVLLHATSEGVVGYRRESALFALCFLVNRACSFAVPGFIFASAVKYFSSGRVRAYPRFWAGRFVKVYWPFALWVGAYMLYYADLGWAAATIPAYGKNLIVGGLAAHLYFVPVIMQFYILMPLFDSLGKRARKPLWAAAMLAAGGAVMYVSRVTFGGWAYSYALCTSYVFYWALGIVVGRRYDRFVAALRRPRALAFVLAACGAVCAAHLALAYLNSQGAIHYRLSETGYMLFSAAAIPLVYGLCVLFTSKLPKAMPAVNALSDCSYYIYLAHLLVMARTIFLCNEAGWGVSARMAAAFCVTMAVTAALSWLYLRAKRWYLAQNH